MNKWQKYLNYALKEVWYSTYTDTFSEYNRLSILNKMGSYVSRLHVVPQISYRTFLKYFQQVFIAVGIS